MLPSLFVTEGALIASLVVLVGCASREVPVRYPDSAPASPEAEAAPPAQVTETLRVEPGELVGGHEAGAARGNDVREPAQSEPTGLGHEGHGGHHGHH